MSFSSLPQLLKGNGSAALAYGLAALPGRPRAAPVLIFAQGRSGSTVLESLLGSTGHVTARGELLGDGHERTLFPRALLRGHARRTGGRSLLCHVKIYHLTRDRERAGSRTLDPQTFLRGLAEEGWRIIYLTRTDRVRHVLSGLVAEARNNYHKLDDRPVTTAVTVRRATLEAWIAQRRALEQEERAALAGLDYHEVVYERDLEQAAAHQQTIDRVLDFLDLSHRSVSTPFRKVNARPLREIVANYDEFSKWLAEMGLESALKDEPRAALRA
ncbi:hypothetical protein [Erythrobacter sp.]|uniref:hypothetical protein n=1 Tax=Erythrobacter sp. TaxID=1042 RepID=UPI0025DCACE1|nr:hypothetical protein [Erythrobacter sp.]